VRFSPFRGDAKAVVVGASGERSIPLPDARYFTGRVAGDPNSIVLLVADPDTARGFVATGGTVYRFGRDRLGVHRSWDLRDADLAAHPRPGDFCGNTDPASAVRMIVPGTRVLSPQDATAASKAAKAAADGTSAPAWSPTLSADVAIDTDQELLALFLGSTANATAYLADLAAAVAAVYLADTDISIRFSSIRLWETTDPWTSNTSGGLLDQLQAYWTSNEGSVARDMVHLVSGRSPAAYGGMSYVNALCDKAYGYGFSTVFGSFDVLDPSATWDVIVVAHELGHTFGSVHTHCYVPPIDQCYSGEGAGCYVGPESVPPGGGTLMSYCDLLPGGSSNINLTFGPQVSAVIRAGAEGNACITTPCGNGILDPGEDCDDGNTVDGDCCSATCTFEPVGSPCDDGEQCTSGDACDSGVCAGTALPNGSTCSDGSACTTDACSSGTCVGTAAPAIVCKRPMSPGKAQIQLLDKTNDRNDKVSFKWTRGQATAFGELGSPDTTDDYDLCIYGPSNSFVLGLKAPAGGTCNGRPCWKKADGKSFTYVDNAGDPDGISKLQVVAGPDGRAKAQVTGAGANLGMPALSGIALPL
ncbi:MAG: M12 family metallo-peptidase, partial [Alphaproteobacteria bacterium]